MKANIYEIEPRNVVQTSKIDGIINNGKDNCYPTRMERIILSSVTAKSAAEMYQNFLVGKGFSDEINEIIIGEINYKPITMYDLLEQVARSISFYNGVFLHCNISFNGKYVIENITPLPFKNCRFGENDANNYSGKIVIYDNWDREKSKKIERSKYELIDVYNMRPEVIRSQIAKAGEFSKYKGQVYWHFFDNEYDYPLSPVDVAQDDADTEYQISQFKNGELNKNFFAKYILRHAYFENDLQKTKFIEKIQSFQGGKNNGSLMVIEDDIKQDEIGEISDNGLKFEKIDQNVNDKLFIDWEKSIANNIRKSFKAIPKILIDTPEGIFGTTGGKAFIDAANFYNQMTKKSRNIISNIFKDIFSNYKIKIESNFDIVPLSFGTVVNE